MAPPIELTLRITAVYTKEGGEWVVSCPALRFAAQGRTLKEAKAEFVILLKANLELWQERGMLGAVLEQAEREPLPLRIDPNRRPTTFDISIAPHLLAGQHGQERRAA